MKEKILIVEDNFVEADYLRLMLSNEGYEVMGTARSVPKAQDLIKDARPDFVLLDIFLKGKLTGIDLAKQLRKENIPFVYLSANSDEEVLGLAKATQPYGFLIKPFREKDLLVTLEIARYRYEHSKESYNRTEEIFNKKLDEILDSEFSWDKKLLSIAKILQPLISFDYITVGFNKLTNGKNQELSFLRIGYDEYQQIGIPELLTITKLNKKEFTAMTEKISEPDTPTQLTENAFTEACNDTPLLKLFASTFHLRSQYSFPLHLSIGEKYDLTFYSRKPDTYNSSHVGLLNRLNKTITDSIESILNLQNKVIDRSAQSNNNNNSSDKNESTKGFDGIIGKSSLLLNVFDLVTQVAPSDTSVLILGESGTGKERIADCIHNLSPRRDQPFVKVNCATLPAALIESELFGHEKGAFTGAIDKRIGKFEKANKGTIFLDEIGEMPLELQVKLLRVLQEKYIERIGSRDVTKIDVRIIAATNINLEKAVAEGRFRLDLYYRLNVFPMCLPSLRERLDDIPALVYHFINHYNRKSGKKITGISDKNLKSLMSYDWPGNIRELENIIERNVLLAKGTVLEDISMSNSERKVTTNEVQNSRMKTIHENERDYIITVLKKCNSTIWGPGGAAEILNIPPSTLKSKMKKLGIKKENYE